MKFIEELVLDSKDIDMAENKTKVCNVCKSFSYCQLKLFQEEGTAEYALETKVVRETMLVARRGTPEL